MDFLSATTAPKGTSGADFLASTALPKNPVRAAQVATYQDQQTGLDAETSQANSFSGFLKNAATASYAPFVQGFKDSLASALAKSFDTSGFTKLNTPVTGSIPKTDFLSNTSAPMTPVPAVDTFKNTLSSTIKDAGDRLYNGASTLFDNHSSALQKGVAVGEAGMGAINALFSPVSASLSALSTIPGVGHIADGVNAVFAGLANGGSESVKGAIDALPLSQQTKDTIKPLAGEVGALVTQILAGKVGGDVYTKVAEKSKAITDAVANDEVVKNTPVNSLTPDIYNVPLNTSKTRFEKYNKEQGYQPYTPNEQLPTIDVGKPAPKPIETLPTIKIGQNTAKPKSDLTYVPIKEQASTPVTQEVSRISPKPLKTLITKKETPVSTPSTNIPAGEAINTRADTLLKAAVEKQFMDNTGDIPTHEVMNMKNESLKAADYIAKNPEEAKAVALGDVPPKNDVFAEHVYNALEIKAFKEGDVALMRELATSKVPTEAGQRLKALDSIDPNSPVKIMRDLQKTREQALGKKGGVKQNITRETESIKSEIKNTVSKRPTWESFIEEIKCAY